jgi:tRNA(Ser,Leu) C12 N-acetylase TAN1
VDGDAAVAPEDAHALALYLLRGVIGAVAESRSQARLIVTSRGFGRGEGRAWHAVKSALPGVWLEGTDFRGVLLAEAEGEPLELAAQVASHCGDAIGRVVPVLAEVESDLDSIREAAARIASQHVGAGESFCFRMHRRGFAGFEAAGRELERDVAESVWSALEQRNGARPVVDLEDPDVKVVAEVFGPITRIGVCRKEWRASPGGDPV